jgi:uncharacterized protein
MTEETPATPYASASSPTPLRPEDEKLWAVLTHLGGILLPVLVPLATYLILRDRGPFIRHHTTSALNFHLTMAIGWIIGIATTWIVIGTLILPIVGLLVLILGIMAAVKTGRGEFSTYPLSLRFIG